jgi:hypothetical protein
MILYKLSEWCPFIENRVCFFTINKKSNRMGTRFRSGIEVLYESKHDMDFDYDQVISLFDRWYPIL